MKSNRKKRYAFLTVMLALLLGLGGCIKPDPSHPLGSATTTAPESPTLPAEPPAEHFYEDAVYVYQTEVDESLLTTELDKDYLILANKVYILGADYKPTCVRLNSSIVIEWQEQIEGLYLESVAALALYEMIDEMKHAGISDIWVTSAYRDYEYQQKTFSKHKAAEQETISDNAYAYFGYEYIYNNYLSKEKTKLTPADAEAVALSYSAAPGTSEHQTGLCIDFTTESLWGALNTEFENTEAFAWLSQNAYKFGFILRYPNGKQGITGYTYEPWHYRFVGREAATDIYYSGLTLEEYLGAVQG